MAYEPDKNDKEILSVGDVTVYVDYKFRIVTVAQGDESAHLTKTEAIAAAKAILAWAGEGEK